MSWRSRIWRVLALVGLLVLVVGGLLARWTAEQVGTLRDSLSRATAAARLDGTDAPLARDPLGSLEHLERSALSARERVDALRPLAEPLAGLGRLARPLPGVGSPAAQAAALWEFGDAVTALGQSLALAGELALEARRQGLGPGLVSAEPALAAHLADARTHFEAAEAARGRLDARSWPIDRLADQLAAWDARAPLLERALQVGPDYAEAAARALGRDRALTYLVLAQTNDELRATGGFVTSVGTIRLAGGRIVEARFEKVYAAEEPTVRSSGPARHVVPPRPISRYLGVGEWRLRDANWWADFPATARQAAAFWRAAHGESVDGVVAFEERGLQAALEALGPVRLADGRQVSADNVKQISLRAVFSAGERAEDWYASQSSFSQELAAALLGAVEQLPSDRLVGAAQRLRLAAANHDLLFWSADPLVAETLRELGLDGAVQGERDDFLYLVESNVGYSKLSQHLRQDLEYAVELGPDGRPTASSLTVSIGNAFTPDLRQPGYPEGYYGGSRWNPNKRRLEYHQDGYYGGYTRVLLPATAEVNGVAGFDEGQSVAREGGRVVVGGYNGLKMGELRTVRLQWQPNVQLSRPGVYRLLVQRQPGAPDRRLTVRLTLPPGAQAQASTSGGEWQGRTVTWRARLDQDRVFFVELAPTGPDS